MAHRGRAVLGVVLGVIVLTAGYGVADANGILPGPLTTDPVPEPYPPFPSIAAPPAPTTTNLLPEFDAAMPDPNTLAGIIAPLTTDPALGPGVSVRVVDAATDTVLYELDGDVPRTPASTAKTFTAVAALAALGPEYTIPTSVVRSGDGIVLIGGGDMMLSAGAGDPAAVVGRAGLGDLAAQTGAALAAAGITQVSVGLDDTVFTGPAISPTVDDADVASGQIAPIAALAVDIAKVNPLRIAPRQPDPAMSAAELFVKLLAEHGISVTGDVTRTTASAEASEIAVVHSAPMREIVSYFMTESDNTITNTTCRLVALAMGGDGSFDGGTAAVLSKDAMLGVDTTGVTLSDCSGLSNFSEVTAVSLTDLVAVATDPASPTLRYAVDGMPIAGMTGTLSDRYVGSAAAGYIRAKTGTLATVAALSGSIVDADGRLLEFAVISNGFERGGASGSRRAIDAIATAIQGCGCRAQ